MEAWLKSLFTSILVLLIVVIILKISFLYLTPFIIAIILAAFINPAVKKFETYTGLDRPFAIFIILIFLIATIMFFLLSGIFQMYLEVNTLLKKLSDYNILDEINIFIKKKSGFMDKQSSISLKLEELVKNNIQLLYNTVKDGLLYLCNKLFYFLTSLPSVLSVILISIISTYFISRDINQINNFIMCLFPEKMRPKIFLLEKELVSTALAFLKAELILVSITGIISYLGFLLTGNNYALLIALCAAFLDLLPFVGVGLLYFPLLIYFLLSGQIITGLKVLLIYVITAVIRQGIEGKVLGSQIGLHPMVTILALYLGFRLMGFMGFIIGPASLILTKAMFKANIIPGNSIKE